MSATLHALKKQSQEERYEALLFLLDAQLKSETDRIACLSNASALMMGLIEDLNWAGFYLVKGEELVLGPFQGEPACNRIAAGDGVCGKALLMQETILVDDVLSFPGHIACDSHSRSELVCPILVGEEAVGVIDWDSPKEARFSLHEKELIEAIARRLSKAYSQWEDCE